MSKKSLLGTIAGYGLMFVGIFTGNIVLAKAGFYVAAGSMLSGVAELLAPKPKTLRAVQTVEYFGTVEPRRIIYGTQKVGGLQTIPPWVSGDKYEALHQVLTLCGHRVESIPEVYFDKTIIADADLEPVIGTNDDGEVLDGIFAGKAWIRRYLGTDDQAVDYILSQVTAFEWDSAHTGLGIAYLALRYRFDTAVYPQGKPEVSALVRGKIVYDPRLDSAPGVHPTSTAYQAWSENPALCLVDYLLDGTLGFGEDPLRIDWDLVVAAADLCDETVTVPSGMQARYTCNVTMECAASDDERRDNLEQLAGAMMGHVVYRGGKWRMYAGAPAIPAFTITANDLIGKATIKTELPSNEKYNYVKGQYIDAAREYQTSEFSPRSSAAYEATDGGRKPREVTFDAVDNEYEAQRNATIMLRRSRLKRACTLQLGLSCYKLRPWDVVLVHLPTLGLNSQPMRCLTWAFSAEGTIEATFLEEASTAWADPAVSDYTVPDVQGGPEPNSGFVPYPPLSFKATGITDGISFSWGLDSRNVLDVRYRIYEAATATDFAGATLIETALGTSTVIAKGDTTTRYYWITATDSRTGAESEPIPDGNGIAAAALTVTAGFRVVLSTNALMKWIAGTSSGTSAVVTTDTAGATGTVTYAWTRTAGSTSITADAASSSSTTFSVTGLAQGASADGTFTLTATDEASPIASAVATILVSFARQDYGEFL